MYHNNSQSFSLLDKVLIKRGFSQNKLTTTPNKSASGRGINLVSMATKQFVSQLPQPQSSNPPEKLLNTMKRTAESLKPCRSSPRKKRISIYSAKTGKNHSNSTNPVKINNTPKKLKVKLKSRAKKPNQKTNSDSSSLTLTMNKKQKRSRSHIFSQKTSQIDLNDVSKNAVINKIRYTTSVLRDLQYDLNNISGAKTMVRSEKTKVMELQKQKNERCNNIAEQNRLLQQEISNQNRQTKNQSQTGSNLFHNMTISFFPDTPSNHKNAAKLLSPFQYQMNKTYR